MIPLAEWMPDRPELSQAGSEAKNCVWGEGRYKEFKTRSQVTSTGFSGDCLGAYSFTAVGSTAKVYAGTAAELYELSTAGWTDVSGATYTVVSADKERWEFAQYGGDVYAVSIGESMQKQTAGSGNFAAVSGAPKSACMWALRDFVMVGDLDQSSTLYPYKIQWSAIGDADSWPSPGTAAAEEVQSGEQALPAQWGRVMAIRGAEYAIIFQEKAITRATYVGAPIVWQFDVIDNERGCIAPGSAVQVGRMVYFWAADGIYETDGSGQSRAIGYGKVDRWLSATRNDGYLHTVSGAHDPERKLILWSFRSRSGSANDTILAYNYAEEKFSYIELGVERLFSATTAGTTLDGLDSYSSSIDALSVPLDSPVWLGGGQYLGAIYSGNLYDFSGSAMTATIDTGEVAINPGKKAFLRAVKPITDGTATVNVGTRKTQNASVAWSGATSVDSGTGFAYFRENAFYHRIRLSISGGFEDCQGIELVARGSSER